MAEYKAVGQTGGQLVRFIYSELDWAVLCSAVPHASTVRPSQRPSDRPPVRLSAQDAGMLLVCLIWGLNFSVTKSAFDQIPPLPFTAIRFIIASLLLWAVIRAVEGPAKLPRRGLKLLIVLGVVGNTCYQLAFTVGLAQTTATNSALILSTVPTVVAVFAGALGLERITPRMRWGIALGTLGVIMVIATRGVEFDLQKSDRRHSDRSRGAVLGGIHHWTSPGSA